MKKGTKLVALLLGLALVIPACNNKPAASSTPAESTPTSESQPAASESQPSGSDSSQDPVNYKVTISNKEELQAEWFVGEPSRKVNIETDPKANIAELVNEGKITITSSDATVLSIAGQMASPVKAGTVTITVKIGDSQDTVEVTLKAQQSVKEKYGVAHEGTLEDPFDNEDACKVAKSEKYNNEDFYVKGVVDRFYYAPGSRADGSVAYYLKAATEGGEQFEVFKVYKDKEQKQPLTDDDIWVGGTAVAHGQFTVYNKTQAETTSAIFVSCEGNKPQPRQTLSKTFAEVLAVGNALKDSDSTWDYYKFEGFVTVKSGTDYYLTATKGEALIPGKSDEAHGSRDIKGTNAIELYGAGKVAELAAKLLDGAKVEVTMTVKNYHGTIENGADLKDADVVVKEAGTNWAVPEPAVGTRTLAEFIAGENTKTKAYNVTATVKYWKNETAAKDKYGNMVLTDGTNDLVVYGASATATALAWDNAESYAFSNPQDFLTNETTAALEIGDTVTMKMIRADYNGAVQGTGIITKVTPAGAPAATLSVATSIAVGDKLIMSAEGEHTPQDGDPVPFKKQFNGIIASGSNKIGEAVDYAGDNPASDVAVLEVVAGNSTGTFALKLGDKYLCWKSGNTLDQQDAVDANASWAFTFADGKATIANSGDAEGKRKLQYNSASPRFATYTSAQKPVTLWKLASEGGDTQEKSVNVTESILVKKDDNKVYVKVSGTAANYTAGEFKWAWGIRVQNGNFVTGKETPEAADYAAATLNADGTFALEYCLTDIELNAGTFYRVYGGTPETYGDIAFTNSETGARDAERNYYLRNDQNGSLFFDAVQPISFTKASVVELTAEQLPDGVTNAGAYLKVGGANTNGLTMEDLNARHTAGKIAGHFQRCLQNDSDQGWGVYSRHDHSNAERFWAIEGDDVFFYFYVGFVAEKEGWQTHFDMVAGNAGGNLNMDVVLTGDVDYTVGGATYRLFADSSKGANQADYYGCLGVYRAAAA